MNSELKVYTLDQVIGSFCGQLVNEGYDENEYVTIEPEAEDYKLTRGADGQGTRSPTMNRGATVKFMLMQTSLANDILHAIRERDLAAPNGAGVGVLQIEDLNNGSILLLGEKAWIEKPPSPGRGKDVGKYEWTIRVLKADFQFLGSPSI